MDLFDRFFGSANKREQKSEGEAERTEYFTNAPSEWLPVRASRPSGIPQVDLLAFFAGFTDSLEERGIKFKVRTLMFNRLLKEGLCRMTYELTLDGVDYCVWLVFSNWDPQDAANTVAVLNRASAEGRIPCFVYFSPYELPAPKEPSLSIFSFRDFEKVEAKDLLKGQYAMWWSSDDDPDFATSPIIALWTQVYEEAEGIYSAMYALLWYEMSGERLSEVDLPDSADFGILLPNGIHAILEISKEKGMRISFQTATTSKQDVRLILTHYLELIRMTRKWSYMRQFPVDSVAQSPLAWWRASVKINRSLAEREEPPIAIGVVSFD